jgi:hypothetical protein
VAILLFSDKYNLNRSESVDMLVGNATTLTSHYVTQYSDMMEVTSTESITWQSSDVSLSSDVFKLDSSETFGVVVGNATTLNSPYYIQSPDVKEINGTESITWQSTDVRLFSDVYELDSTETVDMLVGIPQRWCLLISRF